MKGVVIFGNGDIARLAHHYFTKDSAHEVAAFTVDRAFQKGNRFLDKPVVPFEEVAQAYPPSEYAMFVALSYARMNTLRAAKFEEATRLGYQLVSYVSSRCSFLTEHPVGRNCFILEDNTVQPFVPHVVISGHVRVRPYCFIGVNATLRNGITLAAKSLIGAGAVVMKDTAPEGVYLAPQARLWDRKSSEADL